MAFSSFGKTRAQLLKVYEMAIDSAISISKTTKNGQLDITSLLVDDSSELGIKIDYPSDAEFSHEELLLMEKEIAGTRQKFVHLSCCHLERLRKSQHQCLCLKRHMFHIPLHT